MSFSFLNRGSIGQPAETDPYLPFPAALEAGVITDPQAMARPFITPPGVDIGNGRIPNNKGAGIFDLPGDIAAFDHASLEFSDNKLYILPAPKEAVNDEGQIVREGAVVMGQGNGLLKIVALAIDTFDKPWIAHKYNRRGTPMGKIATISLGMEAPEFEISDISSSGMITASPRRRIL